MSVLFLGCSDAFLVPTTTNTSPSGAPAKREKGHGLRFGIRVVHGVRSPRSEFPAFGGVGWGWGKAMDKAALPGRALDGSDAGFVARGGTSDEEEGEESVALAPALAESIADGEDEMAIEASTEGGGVGGGGEGKKDGGRFFFAKQRGLSHGSSGVVVRQHQGEETRWALIHAVPSASSGWRNATEA